MAILVKKILLLLLISATLVVGLWLNSYLKRTLKPYHSAKGGLLYLLLHLLTLLVLVFAVSWVIIYFRYFFFSGQS
jgi:hypothetical protein